ncbi:MAG: TetR/AcrR family transcriptional regulator [Myxococcota bacterium]
MPADTKAKLLDSAERLARARGYNGFSYADLAQDIGIRTASIHYHFRAKSDLALAMVERYVERVGAALEHVAAKASCGADCIRGYLQIYRDAVHGGSTLCLCVSLASDAETLEAPVLGVVQRFHVDGIAWLADAYRRGAADGSIANVADPELEASATLALVEGAQLMARAAAGLGPFDAAVAQLRTRMD